MSEDNQGKHDVARAASVPSAADLLKRAMGGSLARDALKITGASGAKSELLASIGKIGVASDALKMAGISSAASDALKAASAAGGALQGARISPLSDILEATHHLTDGRYDVTVPSPSVAESLKQADGDAQRVLRVARMRLPLPIKSPGALGQLVRQAREGMGLTQAAFADAAGVGRRFVSELENGKATLELGKVMAVCAAAGLDLMAVPR